jgi:hypothetical protein
MKFFLTMTDTITYDLSSWITLYKVNYVSLIFSTALEPCFQCDLTRECDVSFFQHVHLTTEASFILTALFAVIVAFRESRKYDVIGRTTVVETRYSYLLCLGVHFANDQAFKKVRVSLTLLGLAAHMLHCNGKQLCVEVNGQFGEITRVVRNCLL